MGNRTVYLRPDAEAELHRQGLPLTVIVRRGLGLGDAPEEEPAEARRTYPCCRHCTSHAKLNKHFEPCRLCTPERSKT